MATPNKRGRSSDGAEELDLSSLSAAGQIEEWQPNLTQSLSAAQNAEAIDAGALAVHGDWFAARDDLIGMLGGNVGFAEQVAQATDPDKFGLHNIMGIGVGLKSSSGSYTGDLAVKVFVREKVAPHRLASEAEVPSQIGGLPTDVEAVGELFAQSYTARYPRPVPCGVSCGHVRITAGTIGAIVVADNKRCILSNNHVLANENFAQLGDAIIQPGRRDLGIDPQDRIAILHKFIPLSMTGINLVDAALGFTNSQLVKADHVTFRISTTPIAPSIGTSVIKNGRTTQATQGTIVAIGVNNVRVTYTSGVATFNNQVIVVGLGNRPLSAGGDSGSVIVTAGTKQPTALLFAGSSSHTIANPIQAVMSALGITGFL